MNIKNEYQKEVGSMALSAEFKENLKKKCLEELEKQKSGVKTDVTEIGGSKEDIYSKLKVYKYVSMAACLLAIISTIGVFSMMGSQIKTKSANNSSDMFDGLESIEEEEPVLPEDSDGINYSVIGSGFAADDDSLYAPAEATVDEADSSSYDDEALTAPTSNDMNTPESIPDEAEDEIFDDNLLAKLSDYGGEYITTDYVLGLRNSTSFNASNVYEDINAITSDSGEAEAIDEPSYRRSLNFYDVLNGGLKQESELLGATLVKLTIDGVHSERGIYSVYNVTINYDYMEQTSCKIPARVWVKGNSEHQIEGMPMYSEGDIIITSLIANKDGSVSVLDELLYDVYDLSGTDIAYHRVYQSVNPGSTDMGLLGSEQEFITTAANNPVKYVHKAATRELTRYIRRKITGENYNIADLDNLAKISLGEAEFVLPERPADQPTDLETPPEQGGDESENQPAPEGEEQPADLIDKLIINTADANMTIMSADRVIMLHDPQTTSYLSSKFKNSASGTISSADKSNVMFVGGKLIFNSSNAFSGELIGIEISGAGCSLDISFNGVKVGDSLADVKEALGITKNLASNSKVTYRGETVEVVLTFRYDALAEIEIK